MTWGEVIPDVVLASLYSYLLLRLATSTDAYFKKPFYTFFIATGIYSIISVVSFLVLFQFAYAEVYWTAYIYKMAFAANVFGASGALFGKAFMAIHRYFVMRNRDFQEKNWSSYLILRILIAQLLFSAVLTAPVWPASYVYHNGVITALSKEHTLVLKACSFGMYLSYIFCNGIFTFLTSRELIRLRRAREGNADIRSIMAYQSHMFIIVTVCSISHLIKALQQFTIAIATYFEMQDLNKAMIIAYPIINGLATYAAPVCLVCFSSKVRARLILCYRCAKTRSSVGRYSR